MRKRSIIRFVALTLALCLTGVGCVEAPSDKTTGTTTAGTTTAGTTTATCAGTTTGTAAGETITTTVGAIGTTTTTMGGRPVITTTKKAPNINDIPFGEEINVVEYGVDNTGKEDVTALLTRLHLTGNPIYYPNGTYLFNGNTLNFSGGVRFQSKKGVLIRNSISDTPIVNFDDNGNLIGLMHNHLELKYGTEPFRINGNLVSPPLSKKKYATKVDFIPYWYNDFGRQYTAAGNGKNGGLCWYDWRWNHHDCHTIKEGYDPYDPALHPLLGWYRGDESVVLDWQCYWLQEYGIKQSILLARGWSESTWSDPANSQHWAYNLLNNTPNAKQMKFGLWLEASSYGTTDAAIRQSWWKDFNNFYFNRKYKNMVYCYEEGGKRYPVIFLWDESSIRYSIDKSSPANPTNMKKLYKDVAAAMKQNGYDGVCIFARTAYLTGRTSVLSELDDAGVKWFNVSYPQNSAGSGSTYGERVANFKTLDDEQILYGVATGMNTHDPHPSQWVCPGTSPQLFGQWIEKAVKETLKSPSRAPMITCYNVSEWSEGGPGLVPTVGDRFGYLEAIRDAIVL